MLNPNVEPIAQNYIIAAQVPHPKQYFFHDPGITRLDNGILIIAAPQWRFQRFGAQQIVRILRSTNNGNSWNEITSITAYDATPFVIDGKLLMFIQEKQHQDFQIMASEDEGLTWSKPTTVINAPVWNITTPMVHKLNTIYWAMDYDSPEQPCKGKVMVEFNRNKSPLDKKAWTLSNIVTQPELPNNISRYLYTTPAPGEDNWDGKSATWLEPNTVDVYGKIRVFVRCNIDRYSSANIAAVLDYNEKTKKLTFTQFTAWPGGQCKFFIIHDQKNKFYWMVSNLVTNSQDLLGWGDKWRNSQHGPSGNERRWLFLHYSIDCLNWFPAGCVAGWKDDIYKSFMYPSAVIDNKDLIILSRTSRDSGDQHDADLCTIHRIPNFRDLAMNLHEGTPTTQTFK